MSHHHAFQSVNHNLTAHLALGIGNGVCVVFQAYSLPVLGMVLISSRHHTGDGLHNQWLSVLGAVQQQHAVVATAWWGGLLAVSATIALVCNTRSCA